MLNKIKFRFTFINEIIPYIKGLKRFWVLNLIISVLILLLEFANPIFYKIFIEDVIIKGIFKKFFVVLCGYLIVYIVSVLLNYWKLHCCNKLIYGSGLRIKKKLWDNLFKVDFAEYEKLAVADMKLNVEDDPTKASTFASVQTVDYGIAYIKLICTGCIIFILDWRLALFSILVIPMSFFFDNMISKKEKVYNEKMRVNRQDMESWLQLSIQGWREIKALNLQRYEKRRFTKFVNDYGKLYAKWVHHWAVRVLTLPIIRDDLLMQFGLYFIGGLLIIFSDLRISELLVFTTYYALLSEAIKTVSSADAELQANMPFYNRLISMLHKADTGQIEGIIPDHTNTIELSDVTFAYPGSEKNIIEKFSLTIKRGDRIAITGKSGSGKTTILKLITGMVKPKEGKVSFSGIDLREINLDAMHSRMGYVMQENLLLNLSIRENMIYGREDVTEAEMIEACKKACIYEFINSLPDKFDTVIGERGVKLSGGQKQRIILARLFIRDVDIFIFDEATSALDQYSENIIQDAIENIGRDKTIIVVAHRESSIKMCETNIVL